MTVPSQRFTSKLPDRAKTWEEITVSSTGFLPGSVKLLMLRGYGNFSLLRKVMIDQDDVRLTLYRDPEKQMKLAEFTS